MNNENHDDQTNIDSMNPTESTESQEAQPTVPAIQPLAPATKWYKKKAFLVGLITVIVLGGGISAWTLTLKSTPKQTPQTPVTNNSTTTASTNLQPNQICFTRLAHIVCVDSKGQNRVRYDLPKLPNGQTITDLVAMPDQSQYLAFFSDGKNSSVWTLNSKLEVNKQLNFSEGLMPDDLPDSGASFSIDGKSVVLALDTDPSNSELKGIYRYDLSSGKLTMLIKANAFGSVAVLKDGHILYGSWDGSSGSIYVMNADGTGARVLNLSPINGVPGGDVFSYDSRTDKVLVFGWDNQSKEEIGYANSSALLSGKTLSIIPTDPDQYSSAFFTGSDTIIAFEGAKANIIDLKGKVVATVTQAGEPIGPLDTSSFTKSAEQTEQISEQISGYSSAPADFQTFIAPYFSQQYAQCTKAYGGTQEFMLSVIAVVRDTFVRTGESCADGGSVYYEKINGIWTKTTLPGQSISNCSDVNKYAYTNEIIPTCAADNGQVINNTNP